MNERLLPASIISGMLDIAVRNQISVEALLQESGINAGLVGDVNAHLSESQVFNIIMKLYEQVDDPAFGLILGESIHRSIQSITGDFFATSVNLRQAITKLIRYQDLFIPFTTLTIKEDEEKVDICFEVYDGDLEELKKLAHESIGYYIVGNELVSAGLWGTAAKFLSSDTELVCVAFRHKQPHYYEAYENIFQCPILFGQDTNFLRVSKTLYDKKLYGAMPDYHQRVEEQIETLLKHLKKSEQVLNSVRQFVREHVSDAELSLENAAKSLHMTGRTLQRSLKMENTSFIEIRDSVRSELAKYHLENSEVSIEEISNLVGFSDTSGFYTAFKRWYGVSPGSFRKS